MQSTNKPITVCSTHIHEYSANRIKDPFTGKWVNKTQPQFERILRHRNIVEDKCPSCKRLEELGEKANDKP
jgi:hypothetical protein